MFKISELRQNLLGSLEIGLFMSKGAQRFAADKTTMKKSFIVPALGLPLTLMMVLGAHSETLNQPVTNILITIYSLRLVLHLSLFSSLVYVMARKIDQLKNFCRFITANNWLMLPSVLLMIWPVIGLVSGHYVWADIQPLVAMLTLYSFACTAFMMTHVLRIPWELAGFAAISGLAIHQTSLDVLKWVATSALYVVN